MYRRLFYDPATQSAFSTARKLEEAAAASRGETRASGCGDLVAKTGRLHDAQADEEAVSQELLHGQ